MQAILVTLLLSLSVFMILLILVQRGRGGGLAGVLGGAGGQSAFGVKAGDVFTRITVVTAVLWILLCITTILYLKWELHGGDFSIDQEQPTTTTSTSTEEAVVEDAVPETVTPSETVPTPSEPTP